MKANKSAALIQKIIDDNQRKPEKIFKALLSEKIMHLSYSMISSYEFCPQKYYLEYVKQIQIRPKPVYFVKGTIFHYAAQKLYSKPSVICKDVLINKSLFCKIQKPEDKKHIENAVHLLIQNKWHDDWSVIDVERPFVMQIHESLPPFFGIIDLVLTNGKQYTVVDHKTGKRFNELDAMQLVFYREFVQKEYDTKRVDAYYDQYRWVNNLDRVRKPAFSRSKISINANNVKTAISRVKKAYAGLSKTTKPVEVGFADKCYQCQFSNICF